MSGARNGISISREGGRSSVRRLSTSNPYENPLNESAGGVYKLLHRSAVKPATDGSGDIPDFFGDGDLIE
jgi:hypothetical protein